MITINKIGLSCLAAVTLFSLAGLHVKATLPPDFPTLTIATLDTNAVGDGQIFLEVTDPTTGGPYYLMILQNDGTPLWYQKVTNYTYDFKLLPNGFLHYANIYRTHSWTGGGDCIHEILDNAYNPEESITAGNGYVADSHDFQLLPNGHVLLLGYYRAQQDVSQYVAGGYPNALVAGAVIQELDAQRKVVFQWRSWDHFTIPTLFPPTAYTNSAAKNPVIDAFHISSVVMDTDGNLLVANYGMDVWKISRQTGRILWRLGGWANEFSFVGVPPLQALTHFSGHTLTRLENGNIIIYCNADQLGTRSSKVYEYRLDESNKVATLVWSYAPPTNYYAWHYGSAQRLANGNTFIGWGSANIMPGIGGSTNQWIPACTEVTPDGRVVYEIKFNDSKIGSYRAFRSTYPPSAQAVRTTFAELSAGNTYEDPAQTGVSVTVLNGGGGYNTLTVTRENYAPVNPQFQGRAPRVLPRRTSLTQWEIPQLDAELDLNTVSLGIANPENLTVYYRPQTGQGVFLPQVTVYNPMAHALYVSMSMATLNNDLGEFIFGYPDLPAAVYPPILAGVENYRGVQSSEVIGPLPAAPGTNYAVNQNLPVCVAWSPQGLAAGYHLQIATKADYSARVIDVPFQTQSFYVWSNAAPATAYYYRIRTTNEAGVSDWSSGVFYTAPPAIRVTVPTAGEMWQRGGKYFIQWSDNIAEKVVIDLYRNGTFFKSLATNASTGAYLWQVGLDVIPGDNYSIRISSANNPSLSATSDRPFSLDVPKITKFEPIADSGWVLRWSNSSSPVHVEFKTALTPGRWETVAGPISGSAWTNAPPAAGGFYRLRLQ